MKSKLYTIGHSNHPLEKLISLLKDHNISAVADVRSQPYSKYTPQFNREMIREELKKHGIAYVFLGNELGARSDDPKCYDGGKIQYNLLAQTQLFQQGIERIRKGVESHNIALMCAEADPLTCHRTILLCRHLRAPELQIYHILPDSSLEEHTEAEQRLRQHLHLPPVDLFLTAEELIELAYDVQSKRIAYTRNSDNQEAQEGGWMHE